MKNQKEIIVPIMYHIDEVTNQKVYDFEAMAEEYENKLSELMCGIRLEELENDLYERSAE